MTLLTRAERRMPSPVLMSLRLSQKTRSMRMPARLPGVVTVRNCCSAAASSSSGTCTVISGSSMCGRVLSFTERLVTRLVYGLKQILKYGLLAGEDFDVGYHARQDRQLPLMIP